MFKKVTAQEKYPNYDDQNRVTGYRMGREYIAYIIFGREIRIYKK